MLSTASVTIGSTAALKGNAQVNSVTVKGQVNGNLSAKDKIELKASARVTGDIRAKRLTVEDGVTFVGKSEVNPSGAGRTPEAAPTDTPVHEIGPGGNVDAQSDKGKQAIGKK